MTNYIRNISINRKIRLGYIVLTVAILIISVVSIGSILLLARNQGVTSEQTSAMVLANDAYGSFNNIQITLRDIFINNQNNKSDYYSAIEEGKNVVSQFLVDYEAYVSDENDRANYDALKKAYQDYISQVDSVVFGLKNGAAQSDLIMKTRSANSEALLTGDAFKSLLAYKVSLSDSYSRQADQATYGAMGLTGILFLAAIVVTIRLSNVLSKSIGNAIQMFAGIGTDLARGSLDVSDEDAKKIESFKTQRDEIGILARAFDTMIDSIREQADAARTIAAGDLTTDVSIRSEEDVLGTALAHLAETFHDLTASIIAAAEQVSSGAHLVSQSSMTLSQGATEQASSIEELSASLEEITTSSSKNAQDAMHLSSLAQDILADAGAGDKRMQEMLSAMEEINAASANIGRIIKVIDDIAFQTNILALNAAVEAARAGQHGKGFAVVADEVRNLAGRSAQAVKDTSELIELSVNKVQTGMKIAQNTAQALTQISSQLEKATAFLNGIADTSRQQARGVEQISVAVSQVSQVVQNTAAIAEESAAASQELSTQAERLMEQTRAFKIRGAVLPAQQSAAIRLTDAEYGDVDLESVEYLTEDSGKY